MMPHCWLALLLFCFLHLNFYFFWSLFWWNASIPLPFFPLDVHLVDFMLFIDHYFEMIPLSCTKFLDVFASVSVLLILFHWSIHGQIPHCWNFGVIYFNIGKISPFTLLLKSFHSYAYFSIWILEWTYLGKKKKIPNPLVFLLESC